MLHAYHFLRDTSLYVLERHMLMYASRLNAAGEPPKFIAQKHTQRKSSRVSLSTVRTIWVEVSEIATRLKRAR